ncbi:cation/H+ exchanger 19 [Actinidia rufa]|uniref:Cation/H+ exchanger 19 n=1 Tax=Actinidia rufa TaxID=165716 RepID=A0A7J0GL42_9ERIC|nr:cation/H+ exchanger 19 [Actinidia rufa]
MVHKASMNGLPFWNKKGDDKNQKVIAFEAYWQLSSVTVLPMTAISALNSIHEDICTSAHQKRAAMIPLPFHKHQRIDGRRDDREALLAYEFRMAEHPGITKLVAAPGKSLKMMELGAGVEIREIRTANNVVIGDDGGGDESDKAILSECMACNCQELGPVGSFLASSDFSTTAYVVVLQRYDPTAYLHPLVEEHDTPDMPDMPDTPVL